MTRTKLIRLPLISVPLLAADADPNAKDKGAEVNAQSSLGQSALLLAVNQPGKVRMLLEKGASAKATDATGSDALMVAMSNGSWSLRGISRSPIEEGDIARTTLGIHALTRYPIKGRAAEFKQRVSLAVAYLRSARAQTTDDHAMLLLGLHYAGESAARALLAVQRWASAALAISIEPQTALRWPLFWSPHIVGLQRGLNETL